MERKRENRRRSRKTLAGDNQLQRKAIVVLGMHRSGTSALSELLVALGCSTPATPMPPAKENSRGFFESYVFYKEHEALLKSAKSTWYDYRQFPQIWLVSDQALEFKKRMTSSLRKEFADSPMFVLKDPRICRFLVFWHELFRDEKIEPNYVLIHRNPFEVALSLKKRNGFALEYGCLLWLRHVLDAEFASRGLARTFTSYEHLLRGSSDVAEKIKIALGIPQTQNLIKRNYHFIDPIDKNLKNNDVSAHNITQNCFSAIWVKTVLEIFECWAESGENSADYAGLDLVRKSFNESCELIDGLIFPKGNGIKVELAAAKAKIAKLEIKGA